MTDDNGGQPGPWEASTPPASSQGPQPGQGAAPPGYGQSARGYGQSAGGYGPLPTVNRPRTANRLRTANRRRTASPATGRLPPRRHPTGISTEVVTVTHREHRRARAAWP